MILPSPSSCPARARGWEWTEGRFGIWFVQSILASQACLWADEAAMLLQPQRASLLGQCLTAAVPCGAVPSPSENESPNCSPSMALGDPIFLWGDQGERGISGSVKNSFSQCNVETKKFTFKLQSVIFSSSGFSFYISICCICFLQCGVCVTDIKSLKRS